MTETLTGMPIEQGQIHKHSGAFSKKKYIYIYTPPIDFFLEPFGKIKQPNCVLRHTHMLIRTHIPVKCLHGNSVWEGNRSLSCCRWKTTVTWGIAAAPLPWQHMGLSKTIPEAGAGVSGCHVTMICWWDVLYYRRLGHQILCMGAIKSLQLLCAVYGHSQGIFFLETETLWKGWIVHLIV